VVLRSKRYGSERLQAITSSRGIDAPALPAADSRPEALVSVDDLDRAYPALAELRRSILRDCDAIERLAGKAGVSAANALAARGILAFHENRLDQAEQALERAVAADPQMEEAWDTLAQTAVARGRDEQILEAKQRWYDKAQDIYTRAISHDRGYASYYLERGIAREWWSYARYLARTATTSDYEASQRRYEEAIRIDSQFADAWARKGKTLTSQGSLGLRDGKDPLPKWEEAERSFTEAMRLDRANSTTRGWWSRMHVFRGDYLWQSRAGDPMSDWQKAEGEYLEILAAQPTWTWIRFWLARIRLHRGIFLWTERQENPESEWSMAENELTYLLEKKTNNTDVWQLRGLLRYHRGLFERNHGRDPLPSWRDSESDLTRALRLLDDPETRLALADVHHARATHLQKTSRRAAQAERRAAEAELRIAADQQPPLDVFASKRLADAVARLGR
jgi:tetratricopeptide (TPR) repeat protein